MSNTSLAGECAAVNGGIRTLWMDVGPAQAREWLQRNAHNRPLSKKLVKAFALEMRNGDWRETHQGPAFDDRDRLIDGQHRLEAVVLSGVTIRMLVTFGLPATIAGSELTVMDCVDRGRPRSVADQLKISHELKQGGRIAAIAAIIADLCTEERTRKLSVAQTLAVYREFEPAVDFIVANRSKAHGLRAAGVLGGFAFAVRPGLGDGGQGIENTPVARMFLNLVSPDARDRQPGRPITRLHEFLTGENAAMLIHGLDHGLADLTLEAINLELQGQPIAKLEMNAEGAIRFRRAQKDRAQRVAKLFRLEGALAGPALTTDDPEHTEKKTARPVPGLVLPEPRAQSPKPPVGKPAPPAPSLPPPVAKPCAITVPRMTRPSLDDVVAAVVHYTKLEPEALATESGSEGVKLAQSLLVNVAASYGYTAWEIGKTLGRPESWVDGEKRPLNAMPSKLRVAYIAARDWLRSK